MLLKKLSNPFSLVLCLRISALVVFVITATSRNHGSLPVYARNDLLREKEDYNISLLG